MQCTSAIFSHVAYPPLQYFSTFSHKRHDFREKLWNKICFDFLYNLSKTSLVLRIIERDFIIRVFWSSCPVPIILSILMKRVLSRHFFEKYSGIKCHENPSSRSRGILRRDRLLDKQTDRQTEKHDTANSRFRILQTPPRNWREGPRRSSLT